MIDIFYSISYSSEFRGVVFFFLDRIYGKVYNIYCSIIFE